MAGNLPDGVTDADIDRNAPGYNDPAPGMPCPECGETTRAGMLHDPESGPAETAWCRRCGWWEIMP